MRLCQSGALLAALAGCLLVACETVPVASPPQPEPPPLPPSVVEALPPAPESLPPQPKLAKPKPIKKAANKKTEEVKQEPVVPASVDVALITPRPARQPVKGPAWLAHCASARMEGGVVLCDVDSLIAQPSANVRVFTRNRALAGPVAEGASISYREGLPKRYRLFVVP